MQTPKLIGRLARDTSSELRSTPGRPRQLPDDLLRQADVAMYAAKHGGFRIQMAIHQRQMFLTGFGIHEHMNAELAVTSRKFRGSYE